MVQGYYSLKEAADVLGMSAEQLSRMAQRREIRAFSDGGSWKFRQQDIEELKRSRQLGSDPDIKLADLDKTAGLSSDDEQIVLDATAFAGSGGGKGGKPGSSSDVRLVLSDSGSESEIKLVPDVSASQKSGSSSFDATAELSFDAGDKSPSDSDVRLALDATPAKPKDKSALERTEEIRIDPKLLESTDVKLKAQSGKPAKEKSSSDSEIEFNFDDDLGTGFKVEGDSDFSLASLTDFDANDPSFVKKAKAGSTESLEQTAGIVESDDFKLAEDGGKVDPQSSDSEFELSLESDEDIFATDEMPGFKDSEDDIKPAKSGPVSAAAAAAKKPAQAATESSDSDFELAIDEDFEVEEESGSDVVAIDDDEEGEEAEEDEDEFDDDFGDEVSPVAAAARAKMAAAAAAPVAMAPAPWPTWALAPLALTTLSLGFVGMMMFEVMRNSLSYTQPYALDGTVINAFKSLASMVGLGK